MAPSESEGPTMGGAPLPLSTAWCSTIARRRGGRIFLMFVLAVSGLTLNACQSAGPFYHAWIGPPAKTAAFHSATHRSRSASQGVTEGRQEAKGSTVNPTHASAESGLGRFSTEDRALAEGTTGAVSRFSSPIVGSAQWQRERAEDEAREIALRRKLRICAC